jgi:hypothetical protein
MEKCDRKGESCSSSFRQNARLPASSTVRDSKDALCRRLECIVMADLVGRVRDVEGIAPSSSCFRSVRSIGLISQAPQSEEEYLFVQRFGDALESARGEVERYLAGAKSAFYKACSEYQNVGIANLDRKSPHPLTSGRSLDLPKDLFAFGWVAKTQFPAQPSTHCTSNRQHAR